MISKRIEEASVVSTRSRLIPRPHLEIYRSCLAAAVLSGLRISACGVELHPIRICKQVMEAFHKEIQPCGIYSRVPPRDIPASASLR